MSERLSLSRLGAACLLLALALSPARLCAAQETPRSGSFGFDVCGALTTDPGLADGWPAAKDVRPGEAVLNTDKGLGCRFTPAGEAGGGTVLLEARLTRPTATGDGTAVDRWRVSARKGEPAAIVYAFYPPGRAMPGQWSLAVYDGETRLAAASFTVVGSAIRSIVTPPAAEEALPGAPDGAAPNARPAAPTAPAPAPAPTSEAAPKPAPEAASETPQPQSAPKAAPSEAASKPAATAKGPPAQPAAAKPAAAPATGFYALQTGLFADAANADAQAARIRRRGIPACVAVEGKGKDRRYRVLAGRYGDKRAALATRGEVGRASGVRPLIFAVGAAQAGKLRCH
ncbi:Sporulation domain protein [Solidesulfovibrio fructosivorans JJ]]|uniref:Sporulation domain protein n=1 Tax=Solidesulfovibrio fructosivorans JJ] TaxID=596151 RepID=E1JS35_SOLFR|nr:SPOR domain-containing protein [Solidesulfovibrio fructosivorans]EFL52804.1 Sporulation domain protein [Solidesulfovibrio fructosivorans JJ]]